MSIGSVGGYGIGQTPQYQRLSFTDADADKTGDLSLDEFSAVGQNVPGGKNSLDQNALQALFSTIDSDANGAISRTEAKTAYDKLTQEFQSGLLNVQEHHCHHARGGSSEKTLAAADTDASGGLSVDEFKAYLVAKAPAGMGAPSDSDMTSRFSAIDTDGDGIVTLAEMKAAAAGGSSGTTAADPSTSTTDTAATGGDATSTTTTATDSTSTDGASTDSAGGDSAGTGTDTGTADIDVADLFRRAAYAYNTQANTTDLINRLIDVLKAA